MQTVKDGGRDSRIYAIIMQLFDIEGITTQYVQTCVIALLKSATKASEVKRILKETENFGKQSNLDIDPAMLRETMKSYY